MDPQVEEQQISAAIDYEERSRERQRMMEELGLVGRSEKIQQIMETIIQIAPTNVAVLITGESGTGKEVIARAIHKLSDRRYRPFIPVNCGALAEGILESELFGHEKGAFTGALSRRKGVFELADGGTILLDEIGEMPLATQVELLRVLEEKEFRRVGGMETIRVDVRVIATTNRDLAIVLERGEFRRDLYYRLKVVEIVVPPLRERKGDIPLLVDGFIKQYCQEYDVTFPGISDEAMELLVNYSWPGNVRELRNIVESMIVLSPKKKIGASDIPEYLSNRGQVGKNLPVKLDKTADRAERELVYRALMALRADIAELKDMLMNRPIVVTGGGIHQDKGMGEAVEGADSEAKFEIGTPMSDVEREMIRRTLDKVNGNRKEAAQILGISERTLYRKIRAYGLA